jgi:hypothetical protein
MDGQMPQESAMKRKLARGAIVYKGGSSAPNNQKNKFGLSMSKTATQDAIRRRAQMQSMVGKVR